MRKYQLTNLLFNHGYRALTESKFELRALHKLEGVLKVADLTFADIESIEFTNYGFIVNISYLFKTISQEIHYALIEDRAYLYCWLEDKWGSK